MTGSASPRTLFDKVWDAHVVVQREDGQSLLWIDRHFLHEGSFHAFDKLKARGAELARPDLTFGIEDHYVPTRERDLDKIDPAIKRMIMQLRDNAQRHQHQAVRPRRSRPGHRPCGGARAGADPAGPDHGLR